jgi:hypothetical protein
MQREQAVQQKSTMINLEAEEIVQQDGKTEKS